MTKQFQYRIIPFSFIGDEIDKLGLEGWELCNVFSPPGTVSSPRFVFKREVV